MKYSIDVEKFGFFGFADNKRRLQKDGSLRSIESWRIIKDKDLIFDSLEETVSKINEYSSIVIDGSDYSVNNCYGDLIKSKSVSFNPCIHRLTKPHLFTREELINTIYYGDDSQHNSLIIDINGHIKLQKFEEARALFAPVAVRYETYCEGNDYVGPRAANDLINNDSVYLSMLSGFLTHLTNGRLDQYVDFPPMENETKILADISNLTKHLN